MKPYALAVAALWLGMSGLTTPATGQDAEVESVIADIESASESVLDSCGCCAEGRRYEWYTYAGADLFRNITDSKGDAFGPEQTGGSNFGVKAGANFGVGLLPDYDIGAQVGGTFGVYNFQGRLENGGGTVEQTGVTNQTFITLGIFQRCDYCDCCASGRRLSWGIGYDLMCAEGYSTFSSDPFLTQFRGQVAYALNCCNEIGLWGTIHDRDDVFSSRDPDSGIRQRLRPTNQINVFWGHNFGCGADMRLSVGLAEGNSLTDGDFADRTGRGSTYEAIFACDFRVPASDCLALFASAYYAKPTTTAQFPEEFGGHFSGGLEQAYNLSIGLIYYPGGGARRENVCGRRFMPYLPVVDNGSMLMDGVRFTNE